MDIKRQQIMFVVAVPLYNMIGANITPTKLFHFSYWSNTETKSVFSILS